MSKEIRAREPMPRQSAEERRGNFDEVALGYSKEQAVREAQRCLQCKKKPCVSGCPVEIDIPEFIRLIAEEKFEEAAKEIKKTNALPAICGRVCPQEEQCEQVCVLAKRGQPIAIGRLERFVADWEATHSANAGLCDVTTSPPPKAKLGRVAVVGSGPAGLTAAGELSCLGHEVTVFEALHDPGGVLAYGIPEFRLPRTILHREIEYVKSLGVKIETNAIIGKLYTLQELLSNGYDAIFIGTGAGLPVFMNIPGENLNGIYSANEFLTRVNLMKAYKYPEYPTPVRVGRKVAVVGAGNVAMDAARCSLRLGADEVSIVYRRSRNEMPAREEEIENAEEEGVKFHLLTAPIRFIGDDQGFVNAMECIRMELGEPDDSGRRRPVPMAGSEFIMEVDTVVVAIGQSPNPVVRQSEPGLATTKWGGIIVDEETGATSIPGVYAGGDAVTGAATVITAMGAGRRAAHAIDKYIREKHGASSAASPDGEECLLQR
ncbi:NADPH-dependent glutamate synthase [Candidatus Fermentibacteria bacterium]|nr:NADPH-dependent glutamate synthase [Candidatus Fermentibacteria bacterium]